MEVFVFALSSSYAFLDMVEIPDRGRDFGTDSQGIGDAVIVLDSGIASQGIAFPSDRISSVLPVGIVPDGTYAKVHEEAVPCAADEVCDRSVGAEKHDVVVEGLGAGVTRQQDVWNFGETLHETLAI